MPLTGVKTRGSDEELVFLFIIVRLLLLAGVDQQDGSDTRSQSGYE